MIPAEPCDDAITAASLSGVTRVAAMDAVRARICLAIELGLLRPGSALPRDADTAAALGVSVMTVRRAMARLTESGAIVRRRGRGGGTFVADHVDPAVWAGDPAIIRFRDQAPTVYSLIEQRALFESSLAATAAWNRADASAAAAFAEAEAAADDAAASEDWTAFHFADVRFHAAMARAAGLPWAIPHHERVAMALYEFFVPYPISYLRESNEEHRGILLAARSGDAENAARLAQEHVLELKRSMFVADRPSGVDAIHDEAP